MTPACHRNRAGRGDDRPARHQPRGGGGVASPLTPRPKNPARAARQNLAGLPPRRAAVQLLETVLGRGRALDAALGEQARSGLLSRMDERDRALARAIAATALRRTGQIDAIFNSFLERPLKGKAGPAYAIARAALAEILFMNAPDHAVVNLAVHQARGDKRTRHQAGLLNAVLRKASQRGPSLLAAQDAARLNTPDWLWQSWVAAHGEAAARAIAEASMEEAALDITVKSDPDGWARRLGGERVGPGSVRLAHKGRIEALEGFGEGEWWVQDAAAALPARLLGALAGKRVADLCAAPGGKTAQLAQAGARVTALDISAERLERLTENLDRLGLEADVVAADVMDFEADAPYDAVLLDAPCSATGTIRRHPDIPHLKRASDIEKLAELQARQLDKAVSLVKPGGKLVYCTCSLQPEEGERQIERLLEGRAHIAIDAIAEREVSRCAHTISGAEYVRTWPFSGAGTSDDPPADGFFIARLTVLERQC